MMKPALAIHGGAGTILRAEMTAEKELAYKEGLRNALQIGANILQTKGSALDAVEAAVCELEDCPLFNAGRGSVFTNEGKNEMDAAIMDGKSKAADTTVEFLRNFGGEGGLIAVDAHGNVALPFNSEGMYRGWIGGKGELNIKIY